MNDRFAHCRKTTQDIGMRTDGRQSYERAYPNTLVCHFDGVHSRK